MLKIKLLFAIVGVSLITYGVLKSYDCGHSAGWEARDIIAVKQFAEIQAHNQAECAAKLCAFAKCAP
jgi:hypothetical protein